MTSSYRSSGTSTRQYVVQRAAPRDGRPTGRSQGIRLLMGLAMAAFALISFFASKSYNPVTGEEQYVNISEDQEIAMGLQATPQMINEFGGLYLDQELQDAIDQFGAYLVQNSIANQTDYPFDFHVLADDETINAFALPGGQVFITYALLSRLETEGQLAGVLGHEIGHVLARHGAERIAKQELTQGLSGALVLATYDPENPSSQQTAQVALMIGQLVNMQFGREDELESDGLGVVILAQTGYDPNAMIGVMRILEEAAGGASQPEFFSTHPNPENRIDRIQEAIRQVYPDGVPDGLIP